MQHSSTAYTLIFCLVVCLLCSALVCSAVVVLKPLQERNMVFDRQVKILAVAGLIKDGEAITPSQAQELFKKNIRTKYVNLKTGDYAQPGEIPDQYDPVLAATTPEFGYPAPPNKAKINALPKYAVVYQVVQGDKIQKIILQVWGQGLWSTLYAYLALEKDCNTIGGLTFYEQGETPGLGGEIDNPLWKNRWPGRKAFDSSGKPAITMIKGGPQRAAQNPNGFDAISGATITSRSVQYLLNFWLGENGYGPYLKKAYKELNS